LADAHATVAELIEFPDSEDDEEKSKLDKKSFRNGRILYPCSSLGRCEFNNIKIKIGDVVILNVECSLSGDEKTDFLWVNNIIWDSSRSVTTLRGNRMVFFDSLGGLSRHKGELCMLLHVGEDDERHFNIQGQVEVPLNAVTGKSTVRMAARKSRSPSDATHGDQQGRNTPLCSSILILVSKTSKKRDHAIKAGKKEYLEAKKNWTKLKKGSVEANESTHERGQILYIARRCPGFVYRSLESFELETHVLVQRLTDLERRCGGMAEDVRCTDREAIDLTREQPTYFCADYCAGLGGSAEGSRKAGFIVASLIDSAAECCESLEAKFPGAVVRQVRLEKFVDRLARGKNLLPSEDIVYLHVSFPCNFYSWPKTRSCNDQTIDDRNEAIIHLLPDIIKEHTKHGLRILSMEEGEPLTVQTKHHHRLMSLIGQVRDETGWNIAYKIVNFREHGSSQFRTRLVLFASA